MIRILIGLSTILLAGIAGGDAGSVLWEDRVNLGIDSGNAVVSDGRRAFALGYSQPGIPLFDSPFIRAYDLRTGGLVWERRFTGSGSLHVAESEEDLLFTAGHGIPIRALDPETGSVRWERDPGAQVHGLVADGGRIFAAGLRTSETPPRPGGHEPGTDTDGVVMAYDRRHGTLLWEEVFDSGDLSFDGAYALAAQGNRVFAVGGTYGAGRRLVVRAYDARSGTLLWQDSSEKGAIGWAVAARGHQVFVAGESDLPNHATAPFLRAYAANDGALAWETEVVPTSSVAASFVDVRVEGDRVYAGGTDGSFVVLAVDRDTGDRIWLRRSDEPGQVAALSTAGGRLFASGWLYAREAPYRATGFTQAYDAERGLPLWSDRLDGAWSLTRANAVAMDRLIVIGDVAGDFVLRAYGLR